MFGRGGGLIRGAMEESVAIVAFRPSGEGAIGSDEMLTEDLPCYMAHPGICHSQHSGFWTASLDAASVCFLNAGLAGKYQEGDFLVIEAMRDDGSSAKQHFFVAYLRSAGPAMVLLCRCHREGLGDCDLALSSLGGEFDFAHHIAALGSFYADLGNRHC